MNRLIPPFEIEIFSRFDALVRRAARVLSFLVMTTLLLGVASPASATKGGDGMWASPQGRDQRPGKQTPVASATDAAGNIYISGYELPPGAIYEQMYTVKMNPGGEVVWRAVYQSPGKAALAAAMAVDPATGDVFVTGNIAGDGVVLKYAADLVPDPDTKLVTHSWADIFDNGGTHTSTVTSIALHESTVYVAGTASYGGNNCFMVLAYPAVGGPLAWQIPNVGTNMTGTANAIAVGAGGIAVTGRSPDNYFTTIKYDFTGGHVWNKQYDNASHNGDAGLFVRFDSSGDVVATGKVYAGPPKNYNNIYTAKYAGATGDVIWTHTTGLGEATEPDGLFIDPDAAPSNRDSVYITGRTAINSFNHIYTMRLKAAASNPQMAWSAIFNSGGGTNIDQPKAIVADPSSDSLFVAGYSSVESNTDFRVLKYRKSTGVQLWTRTFHGAANNNDQAIGVALGPDGNPYVVGWADETTPLHTYAATVDNASKTVLEDINTGNWAGYMVKMTNGANSGITRKILSNTATTLTLAMQLPNAVSAGDSHYIYDNGDQDYSVMKYDRGTLNAVTTLSASAASNTSIALDWQDNNPVSGTDPTRFRIERCTDLVPRLTDCDSFSLLADDVAATTYTDSGLQADTYYYYRVIAHNAAVGDTHPSPTAYAVTQFTGTASPAATYTYPGIAPSVSSPNALSIATSPVDNAPVITGNSFFTPEGFDYYTIKLDRNLGVNRLWSQRYGEYQRMYDDVDTCLAVDSRGDVIVSGFSYLNNAGEDMDAIYTRKLDHAAATASSPVSDAVSAEWIDQWTHQYNGPGGGNALAIAIAAATDTSDNVAVVGMGLHSPTDFGKYDIYVLRFPPGGPTASGYWAKSLYNIQISEGVVSDDNRPTAVAVDPWGDVVITGFVGKKTDPEDPESMRYRIYTAKLSGSAATAAGCATGKVPGCLLWEKVYDGGHGNDEANAVKTDSAGNVYVTGYTTTVSGATAVITIKYDKNGNEQWGGPKIHTNPSGGDDEGVAVVVDPIDGNIVIGGDWLTDVGNHDFTAIRYRASDGGMLWQKTLFRPGSDESLADMAMDRSGSVFLTGSSTDATGAVSILTVEIGSDSAIVGDVTGYTSAATPPEARPYAIAVNSLGEAFVAGYTKNAGATVSNLVMKIAGDVIQTPYPLTATAKYSTVTLNWADNSRGESGYEVARKGGACPAEPVSWDTGTEIIASNVAADAITYTDPSVPAGTYCYGVRAKNGSTFSRWVNTSVTTATPPGAIFTPAFYLDLPNIASDAVFGSSPSILYGARVSSTTSVRLSWGVPSYLQAPTGYEIERCLDGPGNTPCTDFAPLSPQPAQTSATQTVYTNFNYTYITAEDTAVCPGGAYRYRIRTNGTGWSATSVVMGVILPTPDNLVGDGEFESNDPGNPWFSPVGSNLASEPPTYTPHIEYPDNSIFGAWGFNGKGMKISSDSGAITGSGDWNRTTTPANATVGAKTSTVNDGNTLSTQGWKSKALLSGLSSNTVHQAQLSRDHTSIDGTEPQYGFRDLRIYDTVNNVELPVLFVSGMAWGPVTVWFKTQANTSGIYAYYGNQSAQLSSQAVISVATTGRKQPILLTAGGKYDFSARIKSNLDRGMVWVNLSQQGYPYNISSGNVAANSDGTFVIDSSTNNGANVLNRSFNKDGSWHSFSRTITASSSTNPSANSYQFVRAYFNPSPCDYVGNTTCSVTSGSATVGTYYPAFNPSGTAYIDDVRLVPNYAFTATRGSETRIDLSWVNSAFDATGYKIERCSTDCGNASNWSALVTVTPATITNYSDSSVTPGSTYNYRMYPYKVAASSYSCGLSGWSGNGWNNDPANVNPVTYSAVTTAEASIMAPSSLAATAVNTSQVNLAWTDNTSSETSFQIVRGIGADCASLASLDTVGPAFQSIGTTLSFSDAQACSDTAYKYCVNAVNHGMTYDRGGEWVSKVKLNFGGTFKPNFLTRVPVNQLTGMDPSFKDIRFHDATAGRELPYWIEYVTPNAPWSARVWVMTGSNDDIYLYFGNSNAGAVSNRDGVMGSGLMAYWSFSNASDGTTTGTVGDMSGRGLTGTLANMASPYGVVSGGRYGNGLSFDGVDDFLKVADTTGSVLDITDEITIEAWYQYQKSPDWGRIVSKATTDGGQPWEAYGLWLDNSSNATPTNPQQKIYFGMGSQDSPPGGAWPYYQTGPGLQLTPGQWYHLVGRYSSATGNMSIFVNGVEYGAANLSGKPKVFTNNGHLYIGGRGDGSGNWNPAKGVIDEVRIYNRALTNQEIAARYAATLPSVPAPVEGSVLTDTNGWSPLFPASWDGPFSSAAAVKTPAPANLTADPDFSSGSAWSGVVGTTTGTSFDTAAAYSGTKSLKLQGTGATLGVSQTVTVFGGAQYTLSGFIKTGNLTSGRAQCDVYGTGIDSTGIYKTSTAASDGSTIGSTSDWTFLAETVTIPVATTSVSIRCFGNGTLQGDAWIDLVQFIPVMPVNSLAATRVSEERIRLDWTFPTSVTDLTGFKVDRCQDASCGTVLHTFSVDTPSARTTTDSGLDINTPYYYRVWAYKNSTCGWDSAKSVIQGATTTFSPPGSLNVTHAVTTKCEDIRFLDGTTSLAYYIANKDEVSAQCDRTTTKFIVKFPSIAAGGKSIHLYYGNPLAPEVSSGDNVFNFFDDFDYANIGAVYSQNKWESTTSDLTGFSIANGKLTGTNTTGKLISKAPYTFGAGYQLQARVKATSIPSKWTPFDGFVPLGVMTATNNNAGYLLHPDSMHYFNNGSFMKMTDTTTPPSGTALTDTLQYNLVLKSASFSPTIYDWEGTKNISYWIPADATQTIGARPIAIGHRHDATYYNGQPYGAEWEWIRVRKFADPSPSSTIGSVDTSESLYTLAGEPGSWGSWRFRKPVTINYPTGSNLTDFQVNIVADTTSLANDRNTLTWVAQTTGETNIVLERCDGADCTTSSFPRISKAFTLPPGTVTYADRDTSVSSDSASNYCYRVKAVKPGGWLTAPTPGQTDYSNTVCQLTANPGAPTNFTAASAATQVVFSWTDNSVGETGFRLERCEEPCNLAVGPNTTTLVPPNDNKVSTTASYTDTTLSATSTYRYRLTAYKDNPDGTSWDRGPVNLTGGTTSLNVKPPPPQNVIATRVSESKIQVTWQDPTSDESGYEVWRCSGMGCTSFTKLNVSVAALAGTGGTVTYNDTYFLVPGSTYGYQIRAIGATGVASDPSPANAGKEYATVSYSAPSTLSHSTFNSNTSQVALNWGDNNSAESGYSILRCTGGFPCASGFSSVGVLNPNGTNFTDSSTCAGTTYTYTVAPQEPITTPLSNNGGQPSWKYRSSLAIANFRPNFITQLTVAKDADMKADYSDIRFFDRVSQTEIPYWIQTPGATSATVWFKSGANNAIDIYYGNASATSASSKDAVFGAGMVGYWPFEEATQLPTTTADVSGTGNNLTMAGFTSPHGIITGGKYGNSLSLDGNGDYAYHNGPTGLPAGNPVTASAEAWVYPTSTAYDYNGIVSWGNRTCTGGGFAMSLSSGARPQFAGWCNDYTSPGAALVLNTWNHLAVVVNGTSAITYYVNGTAVSGTLSGGVPLNIASTSLAVGSLQVSAGNRNFAGKIDEVRVYNRALSQQDINARYASALPTVAVGPKTSIWSPVTVPLMFTSFQAATLAKMTVTRDPAGSRVYSTRPDFRDLRFYDRDANRDLPYWIRKINRDGSNNPISAEVWFMTGATAAIDLSYGSGAANNAASDMVGWWPFEEAAGTTSGSTADVSGWGLNGALSNNFGAGYGVVSGGKNGNALKLDGTGNYVTVADYGNSPLDMTGSITLELWYNYQGAATPWSRIVSKGSHPNEPYAIVADETGSQLVFYVNSGTNQYQASGVSPTLSVGWHHVVGRYDKSTGKISIFVDGIEYANTLGSPITPATNDGALTIGAQSNGSFPAPGSIDDVRIYNIALTDAEIAARANDGGDLQTATAASTPVAFWRFEEAAGAYSGSIAESSGSVPPLPGTFNGFSWNSGYGIVTQGKIGNGLKLDGANNFVTVADVGYPNSSLDITGDITIELWYQYQPSQSWSRLIAKPTILAAQPWDLYGIGLNDQGSAQRPYFVVSNSNIWNPPAAQSISVTGPALTPDNWYHIVARYKRSTGQISMFVNGVPYNGPSVAFNLAINNEPLGIGRLGNYGSFAKGIIDEVAIYNTALEDQEIVAHYTATSMPLPSRRSGSGARLTVVTPVPGNMVAGPDMETGNWTAWPNWTNVTSDWNVSYSGTGSMRITETQANATKLVYQTVTNLKPGATYTLSGYMNAQLPPAGNSYAFCYLTRWEAGWSSEQIRLNAGDTSKNNKGWVPFTSQFVIPANVTQGNLECGVSTDGVAATNIAWFDMVQLAPVAPVITATRISESSINLVWQDMFGTDKTGYNIYRCMDSEGNTPCTGFTRIKQITVNDIPHLDTGLQPNKTYRYKVSAYKNATCPWESAASDVVSVSTAQVAPALQSVEPLSSTSMKLAWTDSVASETGYEIFRCAGSNCEPCTNPADCSATAATYYVPSANLSRSLDQWRKAFYPLTYTLADRSFIQATGTTNLSNQITGLVNTSGLAVGMAVTGPNIDPGTVITGISSDPSTWMKYNNTIPATGLDNNPDQWTANASSGGALPLAAAAGRGDVGWIQSPGIILDDGPMFKMWYSGNDAVDGTWRIYMATSPDGLRWTKVDNNKPANADSGTVTGNGRIPLGSSSANIGDKVHAYASPSVIKDGSTYKMWYSGSDGTYWRIYYATSPDGLNWTKVDNSIPDPADAGFTPTNGNGRLPLGSNNANIGDKGGVFAPTVIKDGSVYKMWYSGYDGTANWRIFHATSNDGLNWTKLDNTIPAVRDAGTTPADGNGRIPLGSGSTGDSVHARQPCVIKDGATYRMWYSGYIGGGNWRTYYATSTDGLNWTKQDNSVPAAADTGVIPANGKGRVPVGSAGKGDSQGINAQAVIKDGYNYRMWYTGLDNVSVRRIYHAVNTVTVTLSKNPTAAGSGAFFFGQVDSRSGTADPALAQIKIPGGTAGLVTGMSVAGQNIADGTTIVGVNDATTITLSSAPAAAGSGVYAFGYQLKQNCEFCNSPIYDPEGGLRLFNWGYFFTTPSTSMLDNDNHTIEFNYKFGARDNNIAVYNILSYSPAGGPTLVISSPDSSPPRINWTYNGSGISNLSTDSYGTTLVTGKWYRLRGVRSGNTLSIYINDRLAATAAVPALDHAVGTRSAPLQISASPGRVMGIVRNLSISTGYSGAVDPATLTFTDMQTCPGNEYNYRVMPVNYDAPWDGATSNRLGNTSLLFNPPREMSVAAQSESVVRVSWSPNVQNDQHRFYLKKCIGGTCDAPVDIGAVSTYDWPGLTGDASEYCFRVAGWKEAPWCPGGGATSDYHPGTDGSGNCAKTKLHRPTDLRLDTEGGGGDMISPYPYKIPLIWTDNSTQNDGFIIERKVWNGEWVQRAVTGSTPGFLDTIGIEPQKRYTYRIRAFKSGEGLESVPGSEFSVTTPAFTGGDDTATCTCTETEGETICR